MPISGEPVVSPTARISTTVPINFQSSRASFSSTSSGFFAAFAVSRISC